MAAVAPHIGEGFAHQSVLSISNETNGNIESENRNESMVNIEIIHKNNIVNADNIITVTAKDDTLSSPMKQAHENGISNQIVSENLITITNDESSKQIIPENANLEKNSQLTERQIQQQEQLQHHLNLAKVCTHYINTYTFCICILTYTYTNSNIYTFKYINGSKYRYIQYSITDFCIYNIIHIWLRSVHVSVFTASIYVYIRIYIYIAIYI
jgi:hypothetical protein